MSKKPLVLFLPKWYPNKFDAFDGNFIENHAIAISKYCDLCILFVHSDPALIQTFKLEEREEHSFKVIRVYFKKANASIHLFNPIINSIRYFKAQHRAYRHFRRKHPAPDLSHIHVLGRTAPLALYLKWFNNIPFLISEHWSGYHPESGAYRGFIKKFFTNFIVKRAAAITVVSENLKKSMLRHGLKGDYHLIPNVVDTAIFKPMADKAKQDKMRLIHISNLSRIPKNMQLIIEALDDLYGERNDFEFILVGTGPEEKEMLEKINALNLSKITSFKGELPMEEVAREMRQANCLLLFSLFENQPCVIIEAFASGIPVISSDVGGIPEIVDETNGQLVPSNDLDRFKTAIRTLLDGKQNYPTEGIRTYALQRFSQEVVGKSFFDLYQSLLKA